MAEGAVIPCLSGRYRQGMVLQRRRAHELAQGSKETLKQTKNLVSTRLLGWPARCSYLIACVEQDKLDCVRLVRLKFVRVFAARIDENGFVCLGSHFEVVERSMLPPKTGPLNCSCEQLRLTFCMHALTVPSPSSSSQHTA